MTNPSPEYVQAIQLAEISNTLPKYRGVKEKAFAGTASPRAAIKAFCLTCLGDSPAAITSCTSYSCPLRAYRPYQKDDE